MEWNRYLPVGIVKAKCPQTYGHWVHPARDPVSWAQPCPQNASFVRQKAQFEPLTGRVVGGA